MMRPEIDVEVEDEAPSAATITEYDRRHFVTYLRLLDAATQKVPWRKVARDVLRRDPSRQTVRVKRCWESHLARARWMSEQGYRQLLG
jgi:5-methylcytosine-specific restriction endonuclease McrA